jgi:acyl-CoA thioesterase II
MSVLVRRSLTLEEVPATDDKSNAFRAPAANLWKPEGSRGVFGGQTVAQALTAAMRTVDDGSGLYLHSMHSYFLLAGDASVDICYTVRRVRDGRSFATRFVEAQQSGQTIFVLTASFHAIEPSNGLEYHAQMPEAPPPESLPNYEQHLTRVLSDHQRGAITLRAEMCAYLQRRLKKPVPMDVRACDPDNELNMFDAPKRPARQLVWMKARNGELGDDPNVHRAILAYMSDWRLLGTATFPVGGTANARPKMVVSLDHSIWFHTYDEPARDGSAGFRADEWLLFQMECDVAGGSRATVRGRVWTRQGRIAASIVQEGLIRLPAVEEVGVEERLRVPINNNNDKMAKL